MDKNKIRDRYLNKKYGINSEEYNQILIKQHGRCAICGAKPKKVRLSVDHLHKKDSTGKQIRGDRSLNRGLLCFYCNNKIIGVLEHRKSLSTRLLVSRVWEYIEQYWDKFI